MTIVTIQQGKLLGAEHQGYAEFLGVPYGAPPVGELRFRPPEAPSPWKGVRDARRLAAPSLQPSTEYDPCQGSEDCLYLNVYKPTGPGLSGPLPAMVWLHGGGFMNGSGNAFFGGLLAQTARAIIVTVNYRLGPFGWLALPSLAAEAKDGNAGNYGLLDNIAALAWVRTNIEAFGGDPERVTVFGQSAGGEQVFALLASPPARGLFQRAISMSAPAGLTLPELAASAPRRVGLLKTLNCADGGDQVARLRRVKAQELINAAEDLNWDVLKSGLPYVPTVGGPVLPGQWVDLFRENKFHHVPVMIGHTKQEGRLFLAIHENNLGRRVTRSDAEGVLRGFYPDAVEKISQEYGLSRSDDPGAAIADLVVDSLFATGLEKCRIALARHTKVFSYQTYDPNAQESHVHAKFSPIHAGHDSDLPPLFQWDDFTSKPASLTPEQQKYAIELGRYFGQFAANGDPNGPDLPEWRPMNDGYVQYIETESTGGTRSILNADYYKDHRVKFWSPLIHPEPAAN